MLYKLVYLLCWPIFKLLFFMKVENRPNPMPKGKLIICSNHISLFDPFTLALVGGWKQVHFLAKKELFDNKILGFLVRSLGAIPIDRQGIDLKAIKSSVNVLKEDKYLGIFPEGTRVKEVKKENIKNGIGYMALKGDANILPLEIVGDYKLFKKLTVKCKPIIRIDNYKDIPKREAHDKIASDIYSAIYDIVD